MLLQILRSSFSSGVRHFNKFCAIDQGQKNLLDKLKSISIRPNTLNLSIQTRNFISRSTASPFLPVQKLFVTENRSPIAQSVTTINSQQHTRNLSEYHVVRFDRKTGKRKGVEEILKRFYRLNWGIWIRTKAGRHKRLWRKRRSRIRRSREHVFCNATQSWLLDKMVDRHHRLPKYWVDDPYNPYHKREEFWATRTKPQP